MASQQDAFSTAYAKQMEAAGRYLEFGMEVAQRMLMAQMDGSRRLFEIQGRQFGALEGTVGDEPANWWAAWCRQAVEGGNAATEAWLKTASVMQAEGLRLMEEFFPMINRSLMGGMEQATGVLTVTAGKAESPRKRAA